MNKPDAIENNAGPSTSLNMGGVEVVTAAHNGSSNSEYNNAATINNASNAVHRTTANATHTAANNDVRTLDNVMVVNDANSSCNPEVAIVEVGDPITTGDAAPGDSRPNGTLPPSTQTTLEAGSRSDTPEMIDPSPISTSDAPPGDNPATTHHNATNRAPYRPQRPTRPPSPSSVQLFDAIDDALESLRPGTTFGLVPKTVRAGTQSTTTSTQPSETQTSATTLVSTLSEPPANRYNFATVGNPWPGPTQAGSWYRVELPQPSAELPPAEFRDSNWQLGGWRGWRQCVARSKFTTFTRQTTITGQVIDLIRAARARDVDPALNDGYTALNDGYTALNDGYTVDLNEQLQAERTVLPEHMFTANNRCHRCREHGGACHLWDVVCIPEKGMLQQQCLECKAANESFVFDEGARLLLTAKEVKELTPTLQLDEEDLRRNPYA
ncbi:uncharacterized protein LOC62_07G009510 [Vanrija pseudolonga]|uniref:Uncharacterized protein n=1 Tax=Vanrija pseudolonga TaxID=143232 RepID=A0AAF1BM96_9TREE|nr:hypothetical protein LOC62_07G009510 [Vanrija pseudolonga]